MWSQVDKEQLEHDEFTAIRSWSHEEIEQMVVMVRLERYNRGLTCGAAALHRLLAEQYSLRPLPSVRKIAEILTRHCLTNARTGWYQGESRGGTTATVSASHRDPQKGG